MNLLSPLSLLVAAGIALPILVSLYILKLKRKPMVVPSAIPWWNDPANSQASTPWQKLRTPPLFWLQLLALLLLALALGRPVDQAVEKPGSRLVIAIDVSASMSAADPTLPGGQTRLAYAKETALALAEQALSGQDANGKKITKASGGVMVVAFADGVAVMQDFTRDKILIERAIDAVRPTDQTGRVDRLLRTLASQNTAGQTEGGLRLVLLTDGRLRQPEGTPPPPDGMEIEVVRTASEPGLAAAENAAFIAFGAQRGVRDPTQVDVQAVVQWVGHTPLGTTATLLVDGRAVAVKEVALPPLGVTGDPPKLSLTFTAQCPDASELEVRFSGSHHDALAADDAAVLTLAPPKPPRVLLVSDVPALYEARAIRAVGVERLTEVTGKDYDVLTPEHIAENFNLLVLVGHAPAAIPPIPSVSFGCVPPIAGLGLIPGTTPDAAEYLTGWQADDPLLQHVSLSDVIFFNPGSLTVPEGATVLAAGQHGPVMVFLTSGDQPHQRHFVASFIPTDSRWVTSPAFPIFFRNVLASLAGLEANARGRVMTPGQTLLLAGHGTGADSVTYQSNHSTLIARPAGQSDALGTQMRAIGPFDRCGLYTTASSSIDPADRRLAVSLLDGMESDLRSASTVQVGGKSIAASGPERIVRRELWPLAVLILLLVLVMEWIWYAKRSTE